MRRPSTIKIGQREYPIICNLNVLEQLQEEYGSVNHFEMKLIGLVIQRDEQGKILYQENGDLVVLSTEPSLKAVKRALVLMVREGERIRQYMDGTDIHALTDPEEILNDCDMPFGQLAQVLHDEYKKCFESKKR